MHTRAILSLPGGSRLTPACRLTFPCQHSLPSPAHSRAGCLTHPLQRMCTCTKAWGFLPLHCSAHARSLPLLINSSGSNLHESSQVYSHQISLCLALQIFQQRRCRILEEMSFTGCAFQSPFKAMEKRLDLLLLKFH